VAATPIFACIADVYCIQLKGILQSFASTNIPNDCHAINLQPSIKKARICKREILF